MKQYLIGGITGYLLTSIFSISPPPIWFWWVFIFVAASFLSAGACWRRFNDDSYGDIDEQ